MFAISLSFLHQLSSSLKTPMIWFLRLLWLALWWKNFVFLSPACSQIALNRCLHVNSFWYNVGGLFWQDWAASCGNGLGCLLWWWALVFLSKGAGVGPIVTQFGPVCAQTYAMPARSKFYGKQNCSRPVMTGWTVADKLWQTDIIITKTEYSTYLNRLLCIPC